MEEGSVLLFFLFFLFRVSNEGAIVFVVRVLQREILWDRSMKSLIVSCKKFSPFVSFDQSNDLRHFQRGRQMNADATAVS
jgi:hypothetical protein